MSVLYNTVLPRVGTCGPTGLSLSPCHTSMYMRCRSKNEKQDNYYTMYAHVVLVYIHARTKRDNSVQYYTHALPSARSIANNETRARRALTHVLMPVCTRIYYIHFRLFCTAVWQHYACCTAAHAQHAGVLLAAVSQQLLLLTIYRMI